MKFNQFSLSAGKTLSLSNLNAENVEVSSIQFDDNSQQTTAYIPANQTPNFWGVQMLNLLTPPVNIYSSCKDLTLLGNQNDSDDAWGIFPNWSCRLYQSTNYGVGDPTSELLTNTTNYPILYYNAPWEDNYYLLGIPILDSSGEDNYSPLITQSIKVYYLGVEKTIAGLS
jgi:hypothetical protein